MAMLGILHVAGVVDESMLALKRRLCTLVQVGREGLVRDIA